jgi:hypothetical protein
LSAPALALGAGLALAGCGDCGPRGARAPGPPPPAPAAAPAPLPEPGAVLATRRGERYSVLASAAPPADALAELSVAAGFRVDGGEHAPAAAVRLELRDVPLEEALAAILSGVAYDVHFEPAVDGGPVVLTRVGVGARSGAAGEDASEDVAPAEDGETAAPEDTEEEERRRAEQREAERERDLALARDARDPRAGVRLEAIDRMDPEGDDRLRLAFLLRDDAVAEVRVAAAERLGEGNPFEVRDSLIEALGDPEPEVVAAAVRSLEDVYADAPDPRIRLAVVALREHRDAGVREAVARFEEWLDE